MGLKSVPGGWVNDDFYKMKKIFWVETAQRFTLTGRVRVYGHDSEKSFVTGLSESDMDPVQEWCQKHNCGCRISFDTFKFRNKKEMTMFLLRWS